MKNKQAIEPQKFGWYQDLWFYALGDAQMHVNLETTLICIKGKEFYHGTISSNTKLKVLTILVRVYLTLSNLKDYVRKTVKAIRSRTLSREL